jgi:hypothetical protein
LEGAAPIQIAPIDRDQAKTLKVVLRFADLAGGGVMITILFTMLFLQDQGRVLRLSC